MKASTYIDNRPKLILRGSNVRLSDPLKAALESKALRLFRHEPRIVRVRVDIDRDVHVRSGLFTATGRVEIAGPDLTASVTTTDAHASVNLLIDKLDRMLRRRTTAVLRRRTEGDIREHLPRPAIA